MQVFKAFFITLKKQSFSILIYFIIFLVLSLVLSGNGRTQTEVVYNDAKIKVAVFDRDNTALSKSLYDYLNKTQELVSIKDDKESISDELFYRNVEYVLIIKTGFEEKIKSGSYEDLLENVKVPDSISGKLLDNKINQYLSVLSAYTAGGLTTDEAAAKTLETADLSAKVTLLKVEGKQAEKSSAYYFYSYIPYVLICMLISGLGSILIIFRKKDLNQRIKCSALTETGRNTALILASLLFGFVCWAVFILLSVILYKGEVTGIKGGLFLLNSLVFLFVAMSLTYLVSFLVKTPSALNMASNIIGLGLSFLGGIFVPQEYMSSSVLRFSKFLPTYWYVVTNQTIESFNSTAEQFHIVIRNLGIEAVFAVIIFAAAILLSRSRTLVQNA
ncbi:ABC transporter permease [Anaerocolumna sp. AGMB13025]|uniref:ABC transporter permease n=1 Tax=Anaerocolumna sp. AGMB13025 TaxID=3039116 RepID=UPI00241C16DE|nr:ABC transporter permease [Anaerocolumna sp. AGMB13025]WFR57742.1 ABC transporter permease [Anaerocolumna sp. AGMB13025]